MTANEMKSTFLLDLVLPVCLLLIRQSLSSEGQPFRKVVDVSRQFHVLTPVSERNRDFSPIIVPLKGNSS